MKPEAKQVLARVDELFMYSADYGEFIRRVSRGPAKAGSIAGTITRYGYRVVTIDRQNYLAHRLVWLVEHGSWPEQDIDHIDGNKLNNHISNLRDVSRSVNQQNRKKVLSNNTTGLLGVSYHKGTKTYRATIGLNRKSINLGHYATPGEAYEAYIKAKKAVHEGYVP